MPWTTMGGQPLTPGLIANFQTGMPTDTGAGDDEWMKLFQEWLASQQDGSAQAFGSTQAGMAAQSQYDQQLAQLQAELAAKQQGANNQFEMEQAQRDYEHQLFLLQKQQEEQAKLRREELLQERQSEFANLLGKGDSVRAVLLGLGLGGNLYSGGQKYQGLGEIEGAQALRGQTEQALTGLQRKAGIEGPVSITGQGVQGLTSPERMAATAMKGGEGINQLLASAFGVGSQAQGAGGGMSADELQRRIQDVTPTGMLR